MAASLTTLARRYISTTLRNASASGGGAAHDGGVKQWKMLSFLVALPAVALCMVNAFMAEHEARPEFIAYEHLRLRTKRFPWGEGQKSLFHNSHANALPDGYEEDEH
ncbi:cytochrome c oxidase subunit 6A, mitochondrial [Penaeus vannamei]|uniref:Mitochondrial cytochrome c oxidase subunit VIa n=1 Tax=Penaeus vannamei TaxID=6689 RepID=A0A0A0RA95_PENVA|nr:cytochrome c oxidase subunit 6A, mitochondrial-like [Penaeus vannamei]AIU99748.1 mitochondrial cytochrome c oxidase subunit VIa precursor [Penaeus vannamei]ROT84115.1 mitochondrial cytochrome c oxidase subunit VIa precursor [Penaeus vannamei]